MKLILRPTKSPSPADASCGARGFSLIELAVASAVLLVVTATAVNYIGVVTQRSQAEQTKVDLTQEGREFVDEFERDIHQSGYPGCADFNNFGILSCATTANYANVNFAAGVTSLSSSAIAFEGDVNGDGVVESVQYRLVDSANNYPPSTTCPCTIQRSEVPKVSAAAPVWSQELQNVVNSGVPVGNPPAAYGGGLPIAGNIIAGSMSNTAYYASVTTFKDFPVFTAYDQTGTPIALPLDNTSLAGQKTLATVKSIRLSINLLASGTTGYDLKTGVRPVVTLVGNGRRNNRMAWEQ
jgi:prepilin-type N-terminal cleavage/methylation domain-containing protein